MTTGIHSRLRPVMAAVAGAWLLAAAAATATPVAAADPSTDPGATPSAVPSPTPSPTPTDTPPPEPADTPSPTDTPPPESTAAPTDTPPASPSPQPSPPPTPSPGSSGPSPTPGPGASPDPSDAPAWPGRFNLYRSGAWVRQYWDYTCTAASTQTMLNIVLNRSNRSSVFQQRIIRYARRHDSLRRSAGSDPLGWARALDYFGAGDYRWKAFSTRSAALRYAAARMVTTGKPVGLLVWRGRHAWTMTGFSSATDPTLDPAARVNGVYVAPPLRGVDPPPNAYIPVRNLGTFARYRETDGLRAWIRRWVVVAP